MSCREYVLVEKWTWLLVKTDGKDSFVGCSESIVHASSSEIKK
tara:strand:+ start:953 stop:1081 length:129 start_codon:yes stop_codon:yes gene_type:complete